MKLPLLDLVEDTYNMKAVYVTYSQPSPACLYHIESYSFKSAAILQATVKNVRLILLSLPL